MRSVFSLTVAGFLLVTAGLPAQPKLPPIAPENQRSSPKVLRAFREVVAQPSKSTVRVLGTDGKEVALGTIVEADGYIVTKASELQGKPVVKLHDGKELPATVVGVEEAYDLAL